MYFFFKTLLSALIIATVTKLAEKNSLGGALLKSLPLTSFLVFFFMKYEGRSNTEIARMSWDIFYLVIPSLVLFVALPLLLDRGLSFGSSLAISTFLMLGAYFMTLKILGA